MAKKKNLKKIGIIVLLVLVATCVLFSLILGGIVKAGVEKFLPKVTGTKTSLGNFSFSMLSGKATIGNLVIGNPDGFKTEYAFKVGTVVVDIDMSSILSKKLVFDEIKIDGMHVIYEVDLSGYSNLNEIKKNIAKFSGGEKKEPVAKEEPKKEGKKIVINEFLVTNSKVSLSATLLQGANAAIVLPDIHLKDIGKEGGGASAGETAEKIYNALLESIGKAVSSGGDLLKGAGDGAKSLMKSIEDLF